MSIIKDIDNTVTFQTFTTGNWPASYMRSGGPWHAPWNPANPSTHTSWRPGSLTYWALFTTNDVNGGGAWLEWNPGTSKHHIFISGDDDGLPIAATFVEVTWGTATDITVNNATGHFILANFLTGNGDYSYTAEGILGSATLGIGIWASGGFTVNTSTFGDIDDTSTVPSSASWDAPRPEIRWKRRSSWAAIAALSVAMPIVQPAVTTPAFDLATFPATAASRHARALHSGGEFAPAASLPNQPAPTFAQATFPDALKPRRTLNQGGEFAPPLPALVAMVPTFFQAFFPDEARSRKRGQQAGEAGPALAIDDGLPALSWAASFPDQLVGLRKSPLLGGAAGPEDSIPNASAPLVPLSWSSSFLDQLKPKKRAQLTGAEGVLAYGGTPLAIGGAAIRQNIPSDSLYTTTLTTFGTDLAVSGVASGIFTTGTHGGSVCDGPFYIQTDGTFPTNTDGVTAATPVYCIINSTSTLRFATTAALAKAGTGINWTSNGSGTFTIKRSIDTSPIGSTFLVFAARGAWDTPGTAPTDSFGNAYTLLQGPNLYVEFSSSKYAIYVCINGKGGRNHTWSLTLAAGPDEGVIGAVEIYNGLVVNSSTIVERALGSASTISSNALTTTARARMLLFMGGNGHTSMDHTFTSPDGWPVVVDATATGDKSSQGYIQNWVTQILAAARGTFTGRASGTVGGNGPEGGQMVLVGVQQLANEPLPLDWMTAQVQDPRAARRRRAIEGGLAGPVATPSAAVDLLQWSAKFPDSVASRKRVIVGGLVDAPLVLTHYDLASFPDVLRSRRRVVEPSLIDVPSVGDARPLSWLAAFPDAMPARRRAVASGEVAPQLVASFYDLATFPGAIGSRRRAIESLIIEPPSVGDARPLSWAASFPDAARARQRRSIVTGEAAPPVVVVSVDGQPLAWSATFPDRLVSRRRLALDVPCEVLLAPPPLVVPPLSWSATFPDQLPRRMVDLSAPPPLIVVPSLLPAIVRPLPARLVIDAGTFDAPFTVASSSPGEDPFTVEEV